MQILQGFKFADLKNYVMKEAANKLIPKGYKMIKSQHCFDNRVSTGKIVVAFDFLNYHPVDYQFHFVINIWIKAVQDAVNYFYDSIQTAETAKWCTTLMEGDFIEAHKELDLKFRMNYYNEVRSLEELEHHTKKFIKILEENALPLAESISTFPSFCDYYLINRLEIVKNFANSDLFVSILMAAFITDKSIYYDLASYLRSKLEEKKKHGIFYSHLFLMLDQLDSFVSSS